MADQYAAMLLSSVLACWVVVGRTVYSRQIDSSIPVVFHIYEQAVMEESTGLFITSLCSLFIIHSSCLSFLYFPLCLSFTPLRYSSLLLPLLFIPLSLSTFPCHVWGPLPFFYPSIYPPTPSSVLHRLCISPPDSDVYHCLLLFLLPPFYTYISISSAAGRGRGKGMDGCMDGWVIGCLDGWVGRCWEEGREE